MKSTYHWLSCKESLKTPSLQKSHFKVKKLFSFSFFYFFSASLYVTWLVILMVLMVIVFIDVTQTFTCRFLFANTYVSYVFFLIIFTRFNFCMIKSFSLTTKLLFFSNSTYHFLTNKTCFFVFSLFVLVLLESLTPHPEE